MTEQNVAVSTTDGGEGGNIHASKSHKESKTLAKVIVTLLLILTVWFLIAGLRSRMSIALSQEEARSYVGILAGVIPIFVVALYVDGTRAWKKPVSRGNRTIGKDESEETVTSPAKTAKHGIFIHSTRWSGVPVTPLQLLSSLLGEVFALGCYLVPTNFQIRFATFWTVSLLALFAFRLVDWAATPDDERAVRWTAALGAILLLLVYAGYVPYILKIAIVH